MGKAPDGYRMVPFPKQRHVYTDTLHVGQWKHKVHGLIEVDVTRRRQDTGNPYAKYLRLYVLVPAFLGRLLWKALLKNPRLVKEYSGTVGLTAVGMFGRGGGWGITQPLYTLSITLGGIAQKPGVVEGRIAIREYLSVTLTFDHDIVDGAPAARCTQRLTNLIESGYGLIEQQLHE